MTELIDRYVYTALRRVPEQHRADIDRELRASIDDAVEARVEGGEPHDAAVEAALLELGDPDRLADSYANRLPFLIGPELFPMWRRLLKMLLTIVLPIVVITVVVIQIFADGDAGKVIGAGIGALINTGVHMCFWTTLVFAIMERTDVNSELKKRGWKPSDLPKFESAQLNRGELATALVWPVLLIVLLVLQAFTFTDKPVLDPGNWSLWWPFFIVVLLAEIAYTIWVHRRGVWTHTVTVVNAVLAIVATVPAVVLLLTHHFYNPEFIATLHWGSMNPLTWLTNIAAVVLVVTAVWDLVDTAVKIERTRRGRPRQVPGSQAL